MAEVYASNEVVAELLNPISGSVLLTVTFRQDISSSERPVYVDRAYARSGAMSSRQLRSRGSISLRKTPESFTLVDEIKRWQKGMVWYNLTGDLKGRTYRHPNLRLTFTNVDGTVDRQIAYGIRLSDRTLSVPQGGLVGDSYSLDVLRGFDLSEADAADNYEPKRALDFARTGSANYFNTAGTLTVATDGQARIGLPYVVRRNKLTSSQNYLGSDWTKRTANVSANAALAPDGTYTASLLTPIGSDSALIQAFTAESGKTYTLTAYLQSATGGNVSTAIAFGGTAFTATATTTKAPDITVTPAMQRFTLTLTAPAAGGAEASVGGFSKLSTGENIIVWGLQLEEGSAATPYQPTNASGVDLTHPLNGAGLLLEGSFTNSLTSPDAPATQTVSLAAGTYTAYMDGTGSMALSGGPTGTVTASSPVTFTLGATTSVTFTVSGSVTRFGCVNLPFRPSHISGTKNADLCGIAYMMNDLKDSHDLAQARSWTVSGMAQPTKSGDDNTVTFGATTQHLYQAVTLSDAANTTRTAAVRMKPGTLSGSVLLRVLDQSGTLIGSTTISSSSLSASEYRTFYVTVTPGTSVTGLRVQLIGNSGTGTVLVRSFGLVQGSHPGIEVRTTDTAIAKPVDARLDPAWVQNGKLRGNFVLPSGANLAAGTVILGYSGGILITQFVSTITLSRVTNSGTRSVSITLNAADGNRHSYDASWGNYTTTAGVRSMPLTLTVDSTTATVDVAALFGDSSWSSLDQTRLISGGTVFATLSAPSDGRMMDWPILPQGAIPAV